MTEHLDPDIGSRVSGTGTGRYGRVVLSARQNHFVSDGRVSHGAPGEAVFAGELLLAALVSCGLGVVYQTALEAGNPEPNVNLTAGFLRDHQDPTRFAELTLDFTFQDIERELAESYVAAFLAKCPIYNTLQRGGPITVRIQS